MAVSTLCLVLVACASETTEATDEAETLLSAPVETTTTLAKETTAMTEPTTEAELPARCITISDFESDAANEQWIVVNDDVMGGQSLGDRTFGDGSMIFSGAINTDGGGFSSLRLPLDEGLIEGADQIVFRARADTRSYMVTFDDSVPGRARGVSFRAPIEFVTPGEWETVTVPFDELFPAAFGTPVASEPFRKDLATRLGIMLSDGTDGEFKLEVDTIEVCESA